MSFFIVSKVNLFHLTFIFFLNQSNSINILFVMKKIFYLIITSILLSACGNSRSISGTIVTERTQFSYQRDFNFTADSHAIIRIYSKNNSENSDTAIKKNINNIISFPIQFSIQIETPLDFSKNDYFISAKVFSQAGDDTHVGDFTTETVTPIPRTGSVTVRVAGLESCDSPNSGGFCSSNN